MSIDTCRWHHFGTILWLSCRPNALTPNFLPWSTSAIIFSKCLNIFYTVTHWKYPSLISWEVFYIDIWKGSVNRSINGYCSYHWWCSDKYKSADAPGVPTVTVSPAGQAFIWLVKIMSRKVNDKAGNNRNLQVITPMSKWIGHLQDHLPRIQLPSCLFKTYRVISFITIVVQWLCPRHLQNKMRRT